MIDAYFLSVMTITKPHVCEKIQLANGLIAEIWDFSRHVAGDRCKVILGCRIAVDVKREYFPQNVSGDQKFNKIVTELGSPLYYEFETERNFIQVVHFEGMLKEMIDTFKSGTVHYLANPKFEQRFIHSISQKYDKDPYRFRQQHRNSIFRQIDT